MGTPRNDGLPTVVQPAGAPASEFGVPDARASETSELGVARASEASELGVARASELGVGEA